MVAHADNQPSSMTGLPSEPAASANAVSAPPAPDSAKAHSDSLYTWSTTLSVAGLASMLWVTLGTVSSAFAWVYPGWVALLFAVVLVVVSDIAQHAAKRSEASQPLLPRMLLWFVNSCLVYTTALGGTLAVQPVLPAEKAAEKVDIAASQAIREQVDSTGKVISQAQAPAAASPTITPPPSASRPEGQQQQQQALPRTSAKPPSTPAADAPETQIVIRPRQTVPLSAVRDAVRPKLQPGFNRFADSNLLH